MKSVTIGAVKTKGREGISSPRKKELLGSSLQKNARITKERQNIPKTKPKTSSVF